MNVLPEFLSRRFLIQQQHTVCARERERYWISRRHTGLHCGLVVRFAAPTISCYVVFLLRSSLLRLYRYRFMSILLLSTFAVLWWCKRPEVEWYYYVLHVFSYFTVCRFIIIITSPFSINRNCVSCFDIIRMSFAVLRWHCLNFY